LNRAIEIANKVAACGPLGVKTSLTSAHLAIDAAEEEALSKLDEQFGALFHTNGFIEGRRGRGRRPQACLSRRLKGRGEGPNQRGSSCRDLGVIPAASGPVFVLEDDGSRVAWQSLLSGILFQVLQGAMGLTAPM